MGNKSLVWLIVGALLIGASVTEAQLLGKVPSIGFLQRRAAPTPSNPDPLADAFISGMRDLGYVDGQNIKLIHLYGGGSRERVAGLVDEILRMKADVIVVASGPIIRAVKQATKTIPIVMITQDDPVAAKFVESLARPGGNITGLTRLTSELSGKRLELFREAVPGIKRIGILVGGADLRGNIDDYEIAARVFNLTLQAEILPGPKPNLEQIIQTAAANGVNALIVNRDAVTASHMHKIAELAMKHKLPSLNEDRTYVEAGGLMSYAASDAEQFRRAAHYVDRILKGAKPRDLPIEQPTKFEFVINLKTAKALNLDIPQSVLFRATRVIR